MRLSALPTAFIIAILLFAATSSAETQTVCSGSAPAGWIRIDDRWDPTKCGNPASITYNVWTIERYDNKPVGAVMTTCADAVPAGWSVIAQKWDPTKCGKPTMSTQNMMTIKRLSEAPPRAERADHDRPRGITVVVPLSSFAARVKAGKEVLASPEGQQYEASWEEIVQTILTTCVSERSGDPASLGRFTFVADVSASGGVSSVAVDPTTDVTRCFALEFGKVRLPGPPASMIRGDKVPVADDILVTQ